MSTSQSSPLLTQATANMFSNFRAEHNKSGLLQQFTQPGYFPELLTRQPCFLIGGRGTGKTTTLRTLAYKGQFELRNRSQIPLHEWDFIGIYLKVGTGRVAAFRGPEMTEAQWERIFGHYLNILFTISLFEFFEWFERSHPQHPISTDEVIRSACLSFKLPTQNTIVSTLSALNNLLIDFEFDINSIGNTPTLRLTPLGAAFEAVLDSLDAGGELQDTNFFFLIDEFENLSPYQQRILNTLIKHARPPYTFKIGVKELGIRERCTVNLSEQLIDPADFRRIDISERLSDARSFEQFASEVCAKRLPTFALEDKSAAEIFPPLFERLSADEEADKLGLQSVSRVPLQSIESKLKGVARDRFTAMSNLERYALWLLEGEDVRSVTRYLKSEDFSAWETRYGSYKMSVLFTLKTGKSGIRKYYCGWTVLCRLAGGNIRYLLELVHRSIQMQVDSAERGSNQVSAELQTRAAQMIGQKNLRELEGLSVLGGRMAKLVLSLGRVFQVMAETSVKHTPEVTQFTIAPDKDGPLSQQEESGELLREAVMHLALVRFAGTKLQQSEDIRDYDYSLHPIFSAFFGYSYRKKRKIALTHKELTGLSEAPSFFISSILSRHNRVVAEDLPEQLALFQDFYESPNR